MSTALKVTNPETIPAPVARGFAGLPCPKCGEEGSVSIDLADLTGDESCTCRECENSFSVADVRAVIRQWTAVLNWIDQAPAIEE